MREYVLIQDPYDNKCWYGYYEGTTCFWSGWDSLEIVICTKLEDDTTISETLEELLEGLEYILVYRSTEPINPKTFKEEYPELFI